MKDEKRFIELLKKAIGDRPQAEFARLTGIAPAQLNRYLNGKATYLPKPGTLEKMALESERRVAFEDFMDACGHEMEKYFEKKSNTPDHVKAREDIQMLKKAFTSVANMRHENLESIVSFALSTPYLRNMDYKIGKERKIDTNGIDLNAEYYVFFTVSCTLNENTARYIMLLTYNRTVNGAVILSDCITDGETLLATKHLEEVIEIGLDPMEEDICRLEEFYVLTPKRELTEQDMSRLRRGISKLVGQKNDKYIGAVVGIGFPLHEFMDEDKIRSFFMNHKESLIKAYQRDIDEYLKSDDIFPNGERVVCSDTGCGGWGAFISNIMSKELNFPVSFWTQEGDDFEFDNNPDCILINEDTLTEKGKTENWALDAIEPYARELGINKIGTVYFQSVFDKEQGVYRFVPELTR